MIIVPNSTFYICFLDDINCPQYLIRILDHEGFEFLTGKKILEEIKKASGYQFVRKNIEEKVRIFEYVAYSEILRPFMSLEEIKKGEDEVFAISS